MFIYHQYSVDIPPIFLAKFGRKILKTKKVMSILRIGGFCAPSPSYQPPPPIVSTESKPFIYFKFDQKKLNNNKVTDI